LVGTIREEEKVNVSGGISISKEISGCNFWIAEAFEKMGWTVFAAESAEEIAEDEPAWDLKDDGFCGMRM
jgi:hypothetical protein